MDMDIEMEKLDWPKAVVSVAVCGAVVACTYLTGNAYCLWGLLIVPMVIYKGW